MVNGRERERCIDLEQQKQSKSVMKHILYKDNCDDLFKNAIVDEEMGLRMFPKKT